MAKPIDMTGQRCGRLTVIRNIPRPLGTKHTRLLWECKCDCGKTIVTTGKSLRRGITKSCGCLAREAPRIARRKPPGESGMNGLIAAYKAGAIARKLDFLLTSEEFRQITSMNCHYCGQLPTQISPVRGRKMTKEGIENSIYLYNGIDRVNNNIGYIFNNCVPCCKICNYAKRKMTEEEFIQWAYRLVKFQNNKQGSNNER